MTKIEWTNKTWNPVTGCTKLSPGCTNCYAERMATRLAGRFGYPEAPHQFDITFHEDRLRVPFHWRKPRMIFVSSMGDLFHHDVNQTDILKVLAVIRACPQHTFQILTKRPERMAVLLRRYPAHQDIPNLWLGVSIENPDYLWRLKYLIRCPTPVRFVSLEPLLAPIDLIGCEWWDWRYKYDYWRAAFPDAGPPLNWVIVGGESGNGARPMHPAWVQDLRDQCQESGVPFFFKQWGAWAPLRSILATMPTFQPNGNTRRVVVAPQLPSITKHAVMYRVGKKRAGHLLDGRVQREIPSPTGATNGHLLSDAKPSS